MKRILSLMLTLALLLSMVPAALAADSESDSTVLIDANTSWSYLDNNTDPAGDATAEGYDRTSWTKETYTVSDAWKTSVGPFGSKVGAAALETGYTAATVLEGCDGANDTPAYFFRTTVNISSLEGITQLTGSVQHDDGLIIYINGVRVAAFTDVACDESGTSLGTAISANLQYGGDNGSTPHTNEFTVTDLSMLHTGENTVSVELHQGRKTSSDVWFYMSSLSLSGDSQTDDSQTEAQSQISDISLSMGADQTKMNFTWYSPDSAAGTLLIAKETELVDGEMPANAQRFEAAATLANDGQYSNQATAINLEAGTAYAYQLVNGEDKSKVCTFTTDDGGAFSFAYVGDPQIGASGSVTNDTSGWENTLNQVATNALFSDISFMLSAGDQVNIADDETQYDGYLNHDLLLNLPVATVVGNHDSGSDAYNEHFNLANESAAYGTTNAGGDSYFVYNNVLFMVLNSNDQSAAEHKAFMEAAIAANPNVSWKIVTFHHSVYTVASHAIDNDILSRREALVPIFTELDIDVVLMGHDHVYCRSYMMNGLTPMTDASIYDDANYSSITNPTGILYVTANSGSGSKTYNIKNQVFPYSAVQNQERIANVAKVTVSDKQFTITTYRATDLSVVDTFTINRTDPAWDVEEKIDAIGEVTLSSEDAIETAREAYDALTEAQKAEVENYQTLLTAESALAALKAGDAQEAAEAAERAAQEAESKATAAQTAAEAAKAAAETAKNSAAADKSAAENAAKAASEAQAKADEAKTAAETARTAAEEASKAAQTADSAAAQKAQAAAEAAAESAATASEAASSAATAAAACQKAQEAQAAAEAAQAAAEAAASKVEADRKAAEEAAKAAEETAKAAAAEAQLILDKYNALQTLDTYIGKLNITSAEGMENLEAIAASARETINNAGTSDAVKEALAEAKTAAAGAECPSVEYSDVPADAWYHAAIDYVVRNGLMQGDGDDTFDPDQELTRAMLVQIIYNMENKPASTAESSFSDVQEGQWYYDAVVWAAENGIVNGYADGTFGADDYITREQMVAIIWRYAGTPGADAAELSFADAADVDAYAQEAVIWASEKGVVNGVGDNRFEPDGNSTRAQASQVLKNFYEKVK